MSMLLWIMVAVNSSILFFRDLAFNKQKRGRPRKVPWLKKALSTLLFWDRGGEAERLETKEFAYSSLFWDRGSEAERLGGGASSSDRKLKHNFGSKSTNKKSLQSSNHNRSLLWNKYWHSTLIKKKPEKWLLNNDLILFRCKVACMLQQKSLQGSKYCERSTGAVRGLSAKRWCLFVSVRPNRAK